MVDNFTTAEVKLEETKKGARRSDPRGRAPRSRPGKPHATSKPTATPPVATQTIRPGAAVAANEAVHGATSVTRSAATQVTRTGAVAANEARFALRALPGLAKGFMRGFANVTPLTAAAMLASEAAVLLARKFFERQESPVAPEGQTNGPVVDLSAIPVPTPSAQWEAQQKAKAAPTTGTAATPEASAAFFPGGMDFVLDPAPVKPDVKRKEPKGAQAARSTQSTRTVAAAEFAPVATGYNLLSTPESVVPEFDETAMSDIASSATPLKLNDIEPKFGMPSSGYSIGVLDAPLDVGLSQPEITIGRPTVADINLTSSAPTTFAASVEGPKFAFQSPQAGLTNLLRPTALGMSRPPAPQAEPVKVALVEPAIDRSEQRPAGVVLGAIIQPGAQPTVRLEPKPEVNPALPIGGIEIAAPEAALMPEAAPNRVGVSFVNPVDLLVQTTPRPEVLQAEPTPGTIKIAAPVPEVSPVLKEEPHRAAVVPPPAKLEAQPKPEAKERRPLLLAAAFLPTELGTPPGIGGPTAEPRAAVVPPVGQTAEAPPKPEVGPYPAVAANILPAEIATMGPRVTPSNPRERGAAIVADLLGAGTMGSEPPSEPPRKVGARYALLGLAPVIMGIEPPGKPKELPEGYVPMPNIARPSDIGTRQVLRPTGYVERPVIDGGPGGKPGATGGAAGTRGGGGSGPAGGEPGRSGDGATVGGTRGSDDLPKGEFIPHVEPAKVDCITTPAKCDLPDDRKDLSVEGVFKGVFTSVRGPGTREVTPTATGPRTSNAIRDGFRREIHSSPTKAGEDRGPIVIAPHNKYTPVVNALELGFR